MALSAATRGVILQARRLAGARAMAEAWGVCRRLGGAGLVETLSTSSLARKPWLRHMWRGAGLRGSKLSSMPPGTQPEEF